MLSILMQVAACHNEQSIPIVSCDPEGPFCPVAAVAASQYYQTVKVPADVVGIAEKKPVYLRQVFFLLSRMIRESVDHASHFCRQVISNEGSFLCTRRAL